MPFTLKPEILLKERGPGTRRILHGRTIRHSASTSRSTESASS